MAKTGEVYVTITADAKPLVNAPQDARDELKVRAGATAADRSDAYRHMYTRHLDSVAGYFAAIHRRRLSPLRLSDRWHARACRRRARRLDESAV